MLGRGSRAATPDGVAKTCCVLARSTSAFGLPVTRWLKTVSQWAIHIHQRVLIKARAAIVSGRRTSVCGPTRIRTRNLSGDMRRSARDHNYDQWRWRCVLGNGQHYLLTTIDATFQTEQGTETFQKDYGHRTGLTDSRVTCTATIVEPEGTGFFAVTAVAVP